MKLKREADLAAEWDLPLEQFRLLRRRHGWAHVKFSRQDIRYSEDQIAQIVRDQTTRVAQSSSSDSGLTKRSASRSRSA